MNLFASMILQSLVRLVIYVDQIVVRYKTADNAAASASEPEVASNNGTSGGGGSSSSSSSSTSDGVWGIDNTVRKNLLSIFTSFFDIKNPINFQVTPILKHL